MRLPDFLTPAEAQAILSALPTMSVQEKIDLFDLLEEKEKRYKLQSARNTLLGFAHSVYPSFKEGAHHRKLAAIFEAVLKGEKRRVIINIAPRMGKSEFSSYLFPAFFLGKYPEKKIIMGTHTSSLSEDFGRRIRNLIDGDEYRHIFPDTKVSEDQKAAGKWSTTGGGQYYAVGVGGSIAGRGADLFVIDDPHSEQDLKSGTRTPFDAAWGWFQTGPLQRLMPGGAIIVIMCMTGDTRVLLADGTEKPLREVRPGDAVATYEDGKIAVSHVNNMRSNGFDSVFTVQTQSGKILRANERHPFLVDFEGDRRWIRLKDLRPGMWLVATRDANAPLDHSPSPDCAIPAKHGRHTTESIPTPLTSRWAITANGKGLVARTMAAISRCCLLGSAKRTTTQHVGRQAIAQTATTQRLAAQEGSRAVTASRRSSMPRWLQRGAIAVMFVVSRLRKQIHAHTGVASSALTTVTTQEKCEGCFVTTATLPSVTEKRPTHFVAPLSTYSVFLDQITAIEFSGRDEVFDVEIDRTENFIANGVVSHNTRWSQIDLTGMLINHQIKNPDADRWEIVELPAILHENTEQEKSLWPEQWPLDQLQAKRAALDPRFWQAQYMQNPTSEVAAVIKRDMWRIWEKEKPPECEYVIQSWDTAHDTKSSADYSACTTWGVWFNEEDNNNAHIVLLEAVKGRWGFPDLKAKALEMYKEWKPDACLIEKKAAGASLTQELRAMGIPVSEFSPSRGKAGTSNDKVARLNSVADIFASGRVWVPETRWAREVVEEVAAFPAGEHDDYVDTVTQALMRLRMGGFIGLPSDAQDDPMEFRSPRRAAYY